MSDGCVVDLTVAITDGLVVGGTDVERETAALIGQSVPFHGLSTEVSGVESCSCTVGGEVGRGDRS